MEDLKLVELEVAFEVEKADEIVKPSLILYRRY